MSELSLSDYYQLGLEESRLDSGASPLERARTQIMLRRSLPPPPAVIADVGGAAGAYAFWLAALGYTVHLIDPVALHIEQATRRSATGREAALASMRVGDARALDVAPASVDAVLLLGPLYHLTDRADRVSALGEARRIVRPGGVLIAAAISRYASLIDGLANGFLVDPAFRRIVERDLHNGQHRNDTDNPNYFTTAFFHTPEELSTEIADAGWTLEQMVAVEGLGAYANAKGPSTLPLEDLLDLVDRVGSVPSLLGASPHLIAIARR
jgi:ubiquinone/menaquinone biosynthesis C-methylase UbiE